MSGKGLDRPSPCFKFLRGLLAGGRSNMYGAIPYLIAEFGCSRDDAFRIVCDWLDQQTVLQPEPVVVARPRSVRTSAAKRSRRKAA